MPGPVCVRFLLERMNGFQKWRLKPHIKQCFSEDEDQWFVGKCRLRSRRWPLSTWHLKWMGLQRDGMATERPLVFFQPRSFLAGNVSMTDHERAGVSGSWCWLRPHSRPRSTANKPPSFVFPARHLLFPRPAGLLPGIYLKENTGCVWLHPLAGMRDAGCVLFADEGLWGTKQAEASGPFICLGGGPTLFH